LLRAQQTGDRFERRRFARSISAQKSHNLPLFDLDGDAAQDQDHVTVDHFNVIEFQHQTPACRKGLRRIAAKGTLTLATDRQIRRLGGWIWRSSRSEVRLLP